MPDDPRRVGGFVLVGRLGAGGMGQVYLGRTPTGERVAVKTVHRHLADHPEFRERFRREVKTAARVSGAFTAEVVSADPDADPPWMATAYVDGETLAELVARDGPRPPHQVWEIGAGVAQALLAIHAAGLVHRDLKPSNVMVAADGPRVIDFGIARALDVAGVTGLTGLSGLTGTGGVVGTPGFIAPEHFMTGKVDGRGDVFSFGVLLFWTATGRSPFGLGPPGALMYRVVHAEPDLSHLSDARLRTLVGACLAKDPARRPNPSDVFAACRLAAAAHADVPTRVSGTSTPREGPSATPSGPSPGTQGTQRVRRRTLLIGTAATLASGGGLFAVRSLTGSEGSAANTRAPRTMTLSKLTTLTGHKGSVSCLAWSRDGRTVASGSWDRTVRLWDVGTGSPVTRGAPIQNANTIVSVAFGPGTTLAVLDVSADLRLWDTVTGSMTRQLARGKSTIVSDGLNAGNGRLVYSNSGRYLAQGGSIWDLQSTSTDPQPGSFSTLAISGRAAVRDGALASYDLDTAGYGPAHIQSGLYEATLDASADGSLAVRIADYDTLWFDDLRTGTSRQAPGVQGAAFVAAFATGDQALVITSTTQSDLLQLWDVPALAVSARAQVGVTGKRVEALAVSPSGRTVALGIGRAVELWTVS